MEYKETRAAIDRSIKKTIDSISEISLLDNYFPNEFDKLTRQLNALYIIRKKESVFKSFHSLIAETVVNHISQSSEAVVEPVDESYSRFRILKKLSNNEIVLEIIDRISSINGYLMLAKAPVGYSALFQDVVDEIVFLMMMLYLRKGANKEKCYKNIKSSSSVNVYKIKKAYIDEPNHSPLGNFLEINLNVRKYKVSEEYIAAIKYYLIDSNVNKETILIESMLDKSIAEYADIFYNKKRVFF